MPFNYNRLRRYARGAGREQLENPAASLEFYVMVSSNLCTRSLLTAAQLRAISLELDRAGGAAMVWQYGAAEALNYVCVLHHGDEDVARVVVAARCVLRRHMRIGSITVACSLETHSRRRAVRLGRLSVETLDVVLGYASARARGDV